MEEKFTIQEIKEEFEKQIKLLKFALKMAEAEDKTMPAKMKKGISKTMIDTAEMMKESLVEGLQTRNEMSNAFNKTFSKEDKEELEKCLNDLLNKLFE